MSNTLPLLNKTITLNEALDDDDNILPRLEYPQKRGEFFDYLAGCKAEIEGIVCFHLNITKCRVGSRELWFSGSFNVCIPVYISPPNMGANKVGSVLVRIPLPFKIGEEKFPGNAEEKLRCELASYLWMQENCPGVAIPFLYGFGFRGGKTFTAPENVSPSTGERCMPSRYLIHTRQTPLETGYMVISRISGQMLSNTWEGLQHDQTRRKNLFHDLARITLQLSKTTLPRIGSLTVNDQGSITLTNRPLILQLQLLENEGVASNISRDYTYSAVEPYLLDFLSFHDSRIHNQPNSIHSENDGRQQLAALTMMRATMHHFIDRDLRHGPFVFTLTDLHQSNIFVDDEWHVTGIIDLEWSASLPVQMQCPPHWLTGRGIDELEPGEHLDLFDRRVTEYIDALAEVENEEKLAGDGLLLAPIMRKTWASGSFWYFHAVGSPKGLFNVFTQHIQPLFCLEHTKMRIFDEVVSPYWGIGASDLIKAKVQEDENYQNRLRQRFSRVPKAEEQETVGKSYNEIDVQVAKIELNRS